MKLNEVIRKYNEIHNYLSEENQRNFRSLSNQIRSYYYNITFTNITNIKADDMLNKAKQLYDQLKNEKEEEKKVELKEKITQAKQQIDEWVKDSRRAVLTVETRKKFNDIVLDFNKFYFNGFCLDQVKNAVQYMANCFSIPEINADKHLAIICDKSERKLFFNTIKDNINKINGTEKNKIEETIKQIHAINDEFYCFINEQEGTKDTEYLLASQLRYANSYVNLFESIKNDSAKCASVLNGMLNMTYKMTDKQNRNDFISFKNMKNKIDVFINDNKEMMDILRKLPSNTNKTIDMILSTFDTTYTKLSKIYKRWETEFAPYNKIIEEQNRRRIQQQNNDVPFYIRWGRGIKQLFSSRVRNHVAEEQQSNEINNQDIKQNLDNVSKNNIITNQV